VDGSDLYVAADTYRINQAGETRLRLLKKDGTAIEIPATPSSYEGSVPSPVGLAIVEEGKEDDLHLVLVLPDKYALDAVGSFSGTRSRATFASALKPVQLQSAINQIKAPSASSPTTQSQGVPAAGIVRVPTSTAGTAAQPKSVRLGAGKWISWTYLQVNHPELVAQTLADVQAGKHPPSVLAGLATPAELNEMLKTNWAAEVARLNTAKQAGVTTRGLSPAIMTPPSAITAVPPNQRPPSPVQREASTAPLLLLPVAAQDLGAAYSGEHNVKSFHVTAPADGYLIVQMDIKDVREKRFRIDQAIAYTGEFVNGGAQVYRAARGGDWDDIRPSGQDPSVRVSMAGSVALDVKAGQRVAIVVAFEPHASIGPPVGRYEAPLLLTWHASSTGRTGSQTVPLRAYCNGIHFGLLAYAEQAEATTLTDRSVDYPIVLTNSGGTPISGSFSATQLPPGVTMNPISITIGPNSAQRAVLRFNVNGQRAQDGPNQDIAIAFNYGGGKRPINLSVSIYHPMIYWCSGSNSYLSCSGPSSQISGISPAVTLQTSDSDVGVDQIVVCIRDNGTWFWKINTHDWNRVELVPSNFKVILRFTDGPWDEIPVHISGYVDFQPYEQWHDFDRWMQKNYLYAAEYGATVSISE
jgi:hypothetical protein